MEVCDYGEDCAGSKGCVDGRLVLLDVVLVLFLVGVWVGDVHSFVSAAEDNVSQHESK